MYMRTFESDTLDEAFKEIKREMGPDAIILKTVTHKGVKGLYKKKKFEITAAIKEKDYLKKAQVDKAIPESKRNEFYAAPASYVNNMIDNYDQNINKGYGQIGLNKTVKTNKNDELEDFLKDEIEDQKPKKKIIAKNNSNGSIEVNKEDQLSANQQANIDISSIWAEVISLNEKFKKQEIKLQQIISEDNNELINLNRFMSMNGISPKIIKKVLDQALNKFSEIEKVSIDELMDFALLEISQNLNIENPLVFSHRTEYEPVITVFISEGKSGQTSLSMKLSTMINNCQLIQFTNEKFQRNKNEILEILKIENIITETISDCLKELDKSCNEKKNVILDFAKLKNGFDENRIFLERIKKSFKRVEVILILNSLYDKENINSIIQKYNGLIDGLAFTFIDKTLSFNNVLNICSENKIPVKIFGTGEVIPNDIEMATTERIIKQAFKL
jgi:flagellar biosynthesis protein FlhF